MDTNLIRPRHIDNDVGLAALVICHSSLFFDWLNDPRIFHKMGDFDAYPFGIHDCEKYVIAHMKDTWLIVSKRRGIGFLLVMRVCLSGRGIALGF